MGMRRCQQVPATLQSRSLRAEPAQGSGAGGELIGLDPEILEHAHVEVGQRGVVDGVECEVLAVAEATPSEDQREVLIAVRVGVTEAAAVEDLGAVEEVAAGFAGVAEAREHLAEDGKLGFLNLTELGDLIRLVAVVRQAVGLVLYAGHVRYDGEGAERKRDDAGAVGLSARRTRSNIRRERATTSLASAMSFGIG